MEIPELSQVQVDAIIGAVKIGLLVQILPNEKLDSEKIFAMWKIRTAQVASLIDLGFLIEKNIDEHPQFAPIKEAYPGREFRMFSPTDLAIKMFSNHSLNMAIN